MIRTALPAPLLPLLVTLLLPGGCASLQPVDPVVAAKRVQASIEVLRTPEASPAAVRRARDDYQAALGEVLPQVLRGDAAPAFVLADDPPVATGEPSANRRFADIAPVRRARVTQPALHRDGIGAPAVGRIAAAGPNSPRLGYHLPLTALAEPKGPGAPVRVRLVNPLVESEVPVGPRRLPVTMDLDAPIDATRATGPRWGDGLRYLLRADRFAGQSRLSFLTPFEPAKRPLVLIHGLGTTPRMWDGLVRDLLADPLVREHYQIWFFFYPTAQPVPLSSMQLREALATAAQRHGLTQPITLVGYSMGGVIARAQVSRLTLDAAETVLPGVGGLPESSPVRQALVFEPNPDVAQVVFMFTPHRGSQFALISVSDFLMRLIRLPGWVRDEIAEVLDAVSGLPQGSLPTSVHGLSPRSRFLAALDAAPPGAPHHSIIGVRRARGDLSRASDGVVPFASAWLASAESTVAVPTGHGGFDHPATVAALLRILHGDVSGAD